MPSGEIPLPDLAATRALAARMAPMLRKGDVLALSGELGAGKTEFARALLHALGVEGEVPSPTFTLVQTYEVSLPRTGGEEGGPRGGAGNGPLEQEQLLISHFDLYRLKSAEELDELGWDDALADGVTLVEWPERAGTRLPKNRLVLHFALTPSGERFCRMERSAEWGKRFG